MTDPGTISIKDYTYFLPEKRIAKYPLTERDASRLLIYSNGEISSPLGLRYPEYEDDLMRKVLEGGGDGDSIEFKNCGKPSRKKPSLVIPYT